MTNSLISFPSWYDFISSLFLRDIFTGYRMLDWPFFSFSTWKMLFLFLLVPLLFDMKCTVIWLGPLEVMHCFFSGCFQYFKNLSPVFSSLIVMNLGMNSVGFCPIAVAELFESVDVDILPNVACFQPVFFQVFFFFLVPHSFFYPYDLTQLLVPLLLSHRSLRLCSLFFSFRLVTFYCLLLSHRSLRLCSIFSMFFLSVFHIGCFLLIYLQEHWLFPVIFYSAIDTIQWVSNFGYCYYIF